ncbi:MAG: hypothetical protein AB7R89_23020 [Dehalococcoidia bacterium]
MAAAPTVPWNAAINPCWAVAAASIPVPKPSADLPRPANIVSSLLLAWVSLLVALAAFSTVGVTWPNDRPRLCTLDADERICAGIPLKAEPIAAPDCVPVVPSF